MTAVSTIDGIKYGFKLMGYQLVVTILSGAIGFAGFAMFSIGGAASIRGGSAEASILSVLVGGAIFLAAAAVWTAGMAGTTYKVVADAVEAGTESASTGVGRPATTGSRGRASGGDARTGRNEGRARGSSSSAGSEAGGKPSDGSSADWSTDDSRSAAGTSVETTRRDSSSGHTSSTGSRSDDRGSETRSNASGSRDRSARKGESRRSDE